MRISDWSSDVCSSDLAQDHKNIACVGDDDQSIYSWRGAQVENILKFEKDFPGAAIIKLEQNYRSTPHILGAASGVIAQNSGRLGKTLWTELDAGDKVRVVGVRSEEHTSELQSLMRTSYAVFCLKKKKTIEPITTP